MKHNRIGLLLISSLLLLGKRDAIAQAQVTKIYTDFGGFWSTDSATRFPNTSHNLMAFTVGTGSTAKTFSTGVDDELMTQKGIAFEAVNYRAMPIVLGSRSGSSYFIGVGSRYQEVWQPPAPSPPYTIPGYQNPEYYLQDGVQGLDLGTAIFNIPRLGAGVTYQVDQFNISRINDGVPDIIMTQVGQPPETGSLDVFKFVDVNGNTVGNEISLDLSTVNAVGTAHWAFYNLPGATAGAVAGIYAAVQPGLTNTATEAQKRTNSRLLRVMQWDLNAFGLNANNVGQVVRFVHILNGSSDPAFVAYNTSSFRALSTFSPGCQTSLPVPVWLQAGRGITADASNQIAEWTNSGSTEVNAIQTTAASAPVFRQQGVNLTGINYNPFVAFTNEKFFHQNTSPFTQTGNFDIYVVARPQTATAAYKIVGFQSGAGSAYDYASLWINTSGQLEFRNNSTTAIVTGTSPGIGKAGIWRISYVRGGKVSISLNGGTPVESATNETLNLPTYNTEYGKGTAAFDLAEIMFYGGNLSATERQRIQSYLSIKYGILYAENYLAGTGDIIWDQANGAYNSRVFGIGREDCMGIFQKQGHSVTAQNEGSNNGLLQIGLQAMAASNAANTGFMPDAHYILYGDNNSPLSPTENKRSKEHCFVTPARTWRTQATGNLVPTLGTQVRVKTDAIWNTVSNVNNYYLLIDRDGNGLYNDARDTAIPASSLSGDTAVFNDVKWDTDNSGADIFTIGLRQATPDAGPDQLQSGSAFTMAASPVSGTWSLLSTVPAGQNVVINNPASGASQVTVPNGTKATLRWTPAGTGAYCYDEIVLENTAPLPVQLEYFTAKSIGQTALLQWGTTKSFNSKGFYIERSADGHTFESIGFVAEKGTEAARYNFTDAAPLEGLNFYRLKQIDHDGQYTYTDVRTLRFEGTATLSIIPNPVTTTLKVTGLAPDALIMIYDASGQLKFKGTYDQLDVNDWQAGLYILKSNIKGRISSVKFIKE